MGSCLRDVAESQILSRDVCVDVRVRCEKGILYLRDCVVNWKNRYVNGETNE